MRTTCKESRSAWGSNPRPLDSKCDALPLRCHATLWLYPPPSPFNHEADVCDSTGVAVSGRGQMSGGVSWAAGCRPASCCRPITGSVTGSVPPAAAYRASPGAAVIAARTAVKSCANQLAEHFTERRRPVRTRFALRLSETIRTSAAGECRRCQAQWQYRYIDERRTGRRQQHANFFL